MAIMKTMIGEKHKVVIIYNLNGLNRLQTSRLSNHE